MAYCKSALKDPKFPKYNSDIPVENASYDGKSSKKIQEKIISY